VVRLVIDDRLEVILLGEVLAAGGTVRVRPLDGGGNETQVEAPASGRFYVKGLENGNYEAVDELGNRRVFTVSQGTGRGGRARGVRGRDAPAGQELPPNYGTEARSRWLTRATRSSTASADDGRTAAVLSVRGQRARVGSGDPPTVPGPDNRGRRADAAVG
jgi:hypothetical protein